MQGCQKAMSLFDCGAFLGCHAGQIRSELDFSEWNREQRAKGEACDHSERCHRSDDRSARFVFSAILHTAEYPCVPRPSSRSTASRGHQQWLFKAIA